MTSLKLLDLVAEAEVVEMALSLWIRRPLAAPLSILDRTMARYEPDDLDFAFEPDQLYPPHPFAELLRLAFASEFNAGRRTLRLTHASVYHEYASDATRRECDRTVKRFADRYRLWLPEAICMDESGDSM